MTQHLIRYCDYCSKQVTKRSDPTAQGIVMPVVTPAGLVELDFHDNGECQPKWFSEKHNDWLASFAEAV